MDWHLAKIQYQSSVGAVMVPEPAREPPPTREEFKKR
jgi:hypothetical protein